MARQNSAVIKAAAIAPFIVASLTRRTAIGIITDSNGDQLQLTGHNDGMRRAWSYALGCYGSGVFPANGLGGYQSGVLDGSTGGVNGMTSAPQAFIDLCIPTGHGGPESGDWFPAGWSAGSTGGSLAISAAHPMDINRGLELHTRMWRPSSGFSTTLNPSIIQYGAGVGTVLWPSSNVPIALPTPPANGITDFKWTIPAGSLVNFADPNNPSGTGGGYAFREQRWNGAGGTDIAGQIGLMYRTLVDSEAFTGVQWSKLITFGGAPTKTPALSLCQSITDRQTAEWFRAHAVTQVDSTGRQLNPIMLIQIIEGGNDAGDGTSSITFRRGAGLGGAVVTGNPLGNTRVGLKNNHQAIINRMRDIWVNTCGYREEDLFFLVGCYHPQVPAVSQYTFVRTLAADAYRDLTEENENVAAVNGYMLATHEEFTYAHQILTTVTPFTAASSITWHREANVDTAHLNQTGYRQWGQVVVGAIMRAMWDGFVDGSVLRGELIDNRGDVLFRRA
jgi:hypothetical protein